MFVLRCRSKHDKIRWSRYYDGFRTNGTNGWRVRWEKNGHRVTISTNTLNRSIQGVVILFGESIAIGEICAISIAFLNSLYVSRWLYIH